MNDKLLMFKVWDYIRLVKSANIHEIASVLRLESKDVLPIVEALQKENYLIRNPAPTDGLRNCGVYYTSNGKEFIY